MYLCLNLCLPLMISFGWIPRSTITRSEGSKAVKTWEIRATCLPERLYQSLLPSAVFDDWVCKFLKKMEAKKWSTDSLLIGYAFHLEGLATFPVLGAPAWRKACCSVARGLDFGPQWQGPVLSAQLPFPRLQSLLHSFPKQGKKLLADLWLRASRQQCIGHTSISEELKLQEACRLYKAYWTLKENGVRMKHLLPSRCGEVSTTMHSSARGLLVS